MKDKNWWFNIDIRLATFIFILWTLLVFVIWLWLWHNNNCQPSQENQEVMERLDELKQGNDYIIDALSK